LASDKSKVIPKIVKIYLDKYVKNHLMKVRSRILWREATMLQPNPLADFPPTKENKGKVRIVHGNSSDSHLEAQKGTVSTAPDHIRQPITGTFLNNGSLHVSAERFSATSATSETRERTE